MKIKKFVIFIIICVILMEIQFPILTFATDYQTTDSKNFTTNDLIRIFNKKTGFDYTITNDTTIEEIITKWGEPKITTDSCFGGHAYTFYTDNNYSNYLYIETLEGDNGIISYGTVNPGFYTNESGYDETYPFSLNYQLCGLYFEENAKTKGGVFYNWNRFINGNSGKTIELFKSNFTSDPVYYSRCISEHAVTMYNALCTVNGYKCNIEFSEYYFYTNEQLVENGSSILDYSNNLGKKEYRTIIGTRHEMDLVTKNGYYLLSPGIYANLYYTEALNKKNMPERFKYGVFEYNAEYQRARAIVVSEDMFTARDSVELSQDEQTKLDNARNYYKTAMELFDNNTGSIYKSEPTISPAENLYAGELNDNMKQAATAYYNAIRAGQGLSIVEQDEPARERAQAMAVLMSYRWNNLRQDITHLPPQPTGVSDSFYKTAIGYGQVSFAENIARSNEMEPSTYAIQKFINQFMDDSSETPFNLGHRTSLLSPSNSGMGYGVAKAIGVMEINHNQNLAKGVDMVAWPSNGITLLETLESTKFRWSAKFYNGYEVTNNTTVHVKCIQTGEEWSFDSKVDDNTNYYRQDDKTYPTELRNRVIFGNETLVPQPGFVYEITVGNLNDPSNNTTTSYTYRSRFEYGDTSKNETDIKTLSIDAENLSKVGGQDNTYYIPIGEKVKLNAKLDDDLLDKKIRWSMEKNYGIIKQNGTILIRKEFEEKIPVNLKHESSGKTATIYLKTYNPNQITLSQKSMELAVDETKELSITEISGGLDSIQNVEWKVAKTSSPNIEYDIDAPEIQEYLQITKKDDNTLSIKGINGYQADDSFKIIAKVKGLKGYFKAEADVKIVVPITDIQFRTPFSRWISITSSGNSGSATIDMDEYYKKYGDKILQFELKFYPSNATASKEVKWEITSNSADLTAESTTGHYKMNKTGRAVIKVTSISQPDVSSELAVNITSSAIKTYNVTGTIEPGKNLQDTTIELIREGDKDNYRAITRPYTRNFKLENIENGKYTLRVTKKGYITEETPIIVKDADVAVPTIQMVEDNFKRGDVNMDGKVNAGDYVAVLNYVRKKISLTAEQLKRADANGDGKINAGDYVTILNIVRGKI